MQATVIEQSIPDGTCAKHSLDQEKSNVNPTVTSSDMFWMDWIGLMGWMHCMGEECGIVA